MAEASRSCWSSWNWKAFAPVPRARPDRLARDDTNRSETQVVPPRRQTGALALRSPSSCVAAATALRSSFMPVVDLAGAGMRLKPPP